MKRTANRKKRTGKKIAALLMICCMLLPGCGQNTGNMETTALEEENAASSEEETVVESTAAVQAVETETIQESATETVTATEEETADYSWIEPYREFLSDHNNLLPLLQEQNEGGAKGFISGFYLYDIDQNGIPELLAQKYHTSDYIYTCVDGEVQLRNVLPYDSFSDALLAYDPEVGKMYYFVLDAGTGTDRALSLSEMYLPEEGEWEKGADIGRERLYGALYGGIEQSDGSYLDVEWEDAIPSEGNAISPEEFQDIAARLVPVVPREITEENLTKYLQEDYLESDLYEPCTLEEYRNQMEERTAAFEEHMLTVTEGSGETEGNVITMEDWNSFVVYCDLDSLACYHKEDVQFVYAEEWKTLYRDWIMNIDKPMDGSDYPIVDPENKEGATFTLYNWSGLDVPVLECISLAGNPGYYIYAEDGQVKTLCEEGRLSFFQGTDYYMDGYLMNMGKFVHVYKLENGEPSDISGYSASVWPEGIYDQIFTVQGNETSMEEFTAYTDANLGAGAAAQLINMVIGNEGECPLTFVEGVSFQYSEMDEVLSNFS